MPRRPRFLLTELPIHVVQRGNDRQPCFFQERDYLVYLKALSDATARYGVLLHAYALMTNHVHLLVTGRVAGGISRLMQSIGAKYVKYVNETTGRSGTLWEGRYRACLVESDQHVLAASRYIDLNPVRAGIARQPCDYRWSSYRELTGSRSSSLVTPHPALEQLGCPPQAAYARWCAEAIDDAELARLREATHHELAYGSEEFRASIEARTGRPMGLGSPGRPRRIGAASS
jgi:REP-associated tyrosine transposase